MNILIGLVLAFIALFFAGSFAYEQYLITKSDQQYEDNKNDLDDLYGDNQSGETNEEAKDN